MEITFFKMDNEYVCSSNSDYEFDFEELCKNLVAFDLKELLLEVAPRLNDIKDNIEISVDWSYEGYRVFIFGEKLTDSETRDYITKLDPVKTLGICDLFWNKHSEQREYTGVVLAYDTKHFHKVMVGAHRLIILTYKGLDEFLEILGMSHDFLPIEAERHVRKLHFVYDKDKGKEIQIEKLKGAFDLPDVEIKNRGRMHLDDKRSSGFGNYWDKKFDKK